MDICIRARARRQAYLQRSDSGTIDLLYVLFSLLVQLYRNMYSKMSFYRVVAPHACVNETLMVPVRICGLKKLTCETIGLIGSYGLLNYLWRCSTGVDA